MASLPKIDLTEVEQELVNLLKDVAVFINRDQPSQLRFTGGWVRDKLLGVGSYDIDVAINDMTGYQFGLRMKEYLEIPGNADKHGVKAVAGDKPSVQDARHVVRDLHKIEANPEKSKHLETVTTKIFGLDIDLVNLRKETYSEDSRNPQMEFGTPLEDALRRDANINAMFYNIQTEQIEDLTGHGWEDMQAKLIRTPLEPYQTFKDDPLRVLRLIRFASRLNYSLDGAAEKAMQDQSIQDALGRKISRERVGVEVDKMLRGPDPHLALQLLCDMKLYTTVFSDPERDDPFEPHVTEWPTAFNTADALIQQKPLPLLFDNEADQPYNVRMLSAAVPYFDAPTTAPSKKKGPIHVEIYRNGLKAPTKLCDLALKSVQNAPAIIQAKDDYLKFRKTKATADEGSPAGRDTLGMLIRAWGPTWKSQCAFAVMLEVMRAPGLREAIIRDYQTFLGQISSLAIADAYALKPVIDGKQLASAFNTKPGPWMKQALEEVLAWQLAQGSSATSEAAIAELQARGWPERPTQTPKQNGELAPRLVRHVLRAIVRPLFAPSSHESSSRVTAAGRAALPTSVPRNARASKGMGIDTFEDAEARRPWKLPREADALDLFEWAVGRLQGRPGLAEECWPLLVPPVLTMVDDVDVPFKARGCRLLRLLLEAVDPVFFKRTGLAEEFRTTLRPCLSYLPTITPQDASISIIREVYPAMITLMQVKAKVKTVQKNAFTQEELDLSQLLHDHLLAAFSLVTADEFPRLTECLLQQLCLICRALGDASMAHLQYTIPTVVTIMSAPFAGAAPGMIEAAAATLALQVELAPSRMWRWRGEVVAGLCEAWLSLEETPSPDQAAARESLQACLAALRKAVLEIESSDPGTEDDQGINVSSTVFQTELQGLVETENSLGGLVSVGGR